MMSDGLFRDMLLWKGFTDVSWKLKIMFVLLYPVMVIVFVIVSIIKVLKIGLGIFRIVLSVINRILGRCVM